MKKHFSLIVTYICNQQLDTLTLKTIKFHKIFCFCALNLLIAFTVHAEQSSNTVNDTITRVGFAYSKDDPSKLLFMERSRYVMVDNEIVWSESKYVNTSSTLAEKIYTNNGSDAYYNYQYKDGYNEIVNRNKNKYNCSIKESFGKKMVIKTLSNIEPLMFDEGVISTILKNQVGLKSGERIPLNILVPERAAHYSFYLELRNKNSEASYTYALVPSNFLIKTFLPDFLFTLHNGKLERVEGLSKVGAQLDCPEVVIKYKV